MIAHHARRLLGRRRVDAFDDALRDRAEDERRVREAVDRILRRERAPRR